MSTINKRGLNDAILQSKDERRIKRIRNTKRCWQLYLFLLPALIVLILFSYVPMYGIQLAFKDYNPIDGIIGSKFVWFENFDRFFNSYQSKQIIANTLIISIYSLVAGFPIPIILALCLNHVKNLRYKKIVQTVTYAPHFISTVVLIGMLNIFLSVNGGLMNQIIGYFGIKPILFLGREDLFRDIYVWSGVWQSMGWGAVIYLAALAGVSPELHEAAIVDGATKLKRIQHIDIPAILPTIVILLILNCGSIMSVGFEKAYLMQNPLNLGHSEVISTYTYKKGLIDAEYGFSTAVGLFNSAINCILLVTVNKIAKKCGQESIW